MHGSFLLIPAAIEKELTWDFGARSQITEDAYLALKAMEKNIQFDWIDGYIKEQSPFSFKDFLNQRARWFCGLAMVITDKKLKFTSRFGLVLMIVSWSVTWLATFVTIANIVSGFIAGENYFPFWAVVATSIITGVVGSVYMIGAYRNVLYWNAPTLKKIIIVLETYILFLFQVLAIMEGIAVITSILRLLKTMFFKSHTDFYVVAKD
jgi:egghead protein (zeste-white 4 protein)